MTDKQSPMSPEEAQKIRKNAGSMPVTDVTKDIAEISQQAPRYPDEEEAFLEHKLRLLESDPSVSETEKAKLRSALQTKFRKRASQSDQPLPPGGVGYGTFYSSDFRSSFGTGTAIQHFIHCPSTPGGNVDDYLYLTSTNRSSKGVEAFVLYYKQNQLSFRVFDWAKPDDQHWQTNLPFTALGDYIFELDDGGTAYQCLFAANLTYQTDLSQWTNAVFLLNRRQARFDLIYLYSYACTTSEQKTGWVGSWAPIVETFQDQCRNTNNLGFLHTSLTSRFSAIGAWSPSGWQDLSASQSSLRNDNKGFEIVRMEPNHTFIVKGRSE